MNDNEINPTTGFPMAGGCDISGTPYGFSSEYSSDSFVSQNSLDSFWSNNSHYDFSDEEKTNEINPTTGLPMAGGYDISGTPYDFSDEEKTEEDVSLVVKILIGFIWISLLGTSLYVRFFA